MNNSKAPYIIIYEDKDILVVYKKRDVLTIRTSDKMTFTHNLYHYLKLYLEKKKENLFIVHRLDYETSGLLIFAKSSIMKEKIQKAFEEHLVIREYEGVIKEKIPLGKRFHVDQYLLDDDSKVVISDSSLGKEAITDIESINYINIGTAIKINITTGRRNQIRLAIHSLNFTLLGDKRYSSSIEKRMYLNAYHLSFPTDLGLKQSDFFLTPLWIKETNSKN